MELPIVKIGFPVLRKVCERVDPRTLQTGHFKAFFKSMTVTMRKAQGVGLAANQVGVDLQAIVLECKASKRYPAAPSFPLQAYVNPRIVSASRETDLDWEGCLSIPGYRGLVPRHKTVVVEATAPNGRVIRRKVRGFEARVFQHEIDHINGRFYVDRMPDLKTWMHEEEMMKLARSAARKRKNKKA